MSAAATEVIVVGAGVVGLACAWRLSQRGLAVSLVDPDPAGAASRAAAGMLAPVSEVTYGEEPLLRLSIESLRRYPEFVAELETATGQVVGLRRDGTLVVATDAGDREVLVRLHDFQRQLGLPATLLTSRETRRVEPTLTPAVRAGLLVDGDFSVDNRRLTAALLAAATGAGARLVADLVTSLDSDGSQVRGVRLGSGGRLNARWVVLAAGPWSALPGVPESVRPPVRPVKGQILRLRAADPGQLPGRTVRAFVGGEEIYLVPRRDGELVVGATVEEQGFDTSVTAGAVHTLLRAARGVLPGVDELELVETMAALRPGSPDNLPILGPTALGGLVVATGHYRNGILLSPLTADLVSDWVTGGMDGSAWYAAVSPERFAPVGAGA